MMGSETTNHQDTAIKVLRTRRNMFVEFEFQCGDPDLEDPAAGKAASWSARRRL
jgi:hypothetical protein